MRKGPLVVLGRVAGTSRSPNKLLYTTGILLPHSFLPYQHLLPLILPYTHHALPNQLLLNWSIPIVNHLWLEDCFIQWKNLTVDIGKYIDFLPGTDFATILGKSGVWEGHFGGSWKGRV
ncbi:hypothetical protein PILCRDRAFT_810179 [Piloderma croceum F 1598]|uniref:BRCT domain-containing protein n=1 Tax=Piloderma croceum (strain F 1598) TaxID=765440 RepID=A0A0C3G7I2_PILCF|nr:hypothetical protein PILCRDRAFT_810179 [Piloderma croceum F 1598]